MNSVPVDEEAMAAISVRRALGVIIILELGIK